MSCGGCPCKRPRQPLAKAPKLPHGTWHHPKICRHPLPVITKPAAQPGSHPSQSGLPGAYWAPVIIFGNLRCRVGRVGTVIGVSTCPSGNGFWIVPHTEIDIDSKDGLTAKRSRKGGKSGPERVTLRDVRDVTESSFAVKERPSRESERMVDISPNSGGRSGKYPYTMPVTSMTTSVITGEGTVRFENI